MQSSNKSNYVSVTIHHKWWKLINHCKEHQNMDINNLRIQEGIPVFLEERLTPLAGAEELRKAKL